MASEVKVGFHKLVYRLYWVARAAARTAGVSRILRRTVGPLAGRFVFNSTAGSDRPLVIQGHKMFLATEGRYPSPDMVVDRYEQATTSLFRQLLKPGMVVVDIGAHVGYFSLLAAKLVGPEGKVYAFEPEPSNHLLLLRNIEINNYTTIRAQRKAVSNRSGSMDLFLSALDSGSHSLHAAGARGVTGTARVEATTLDAFLEAEGWPKVDLIKIDVEGAEVAVLEGMRQLLDQRRGLKLVVEFCPLLLQSAGVSPSALPDKLASLGFAVHVIDDKRGVLPAEATNMSSLTEDLLKQERYVNLFCARE